MASQQELLSLLARKSAFCMDKEHLKEGILSRTIPLSESAARGTLQMETSDEALLKALEQGILIACNSSAKVPDEQQTHSLVSNEYELPPIETAIH
ncbi:P0560B06.27 [Oryza sativa Japonica Group]|uniref:Uncharacterized protein n=2 Tax=Oryza sativa subsp. japonica TaxID=39947 RepID=Q5JJK2_ORYSJ|nr:hypothetical protein [Oryza sativa Japonica Group]BAB64760.1 P0560B06.27 [Oryza sativa Japonica Group]BAD88355.1 hypothetical protein [Oryza sativa Japonica Group]